MVRWQDCLVMCSCLTCVMYITLGPIMFGWLTDMSKFCSDKYKKLSGNVWCLTVTSSSTVCVEFHTPKLCECSRWECFSNTCISSHLLFSSQFIGSEYYCCCSPFSVCWLTTCLTAWLQFHVILNIRRWVLTDWLHVCGTYSNMSAWPSSQITSQGARLGAPLSLS